MGWGTIFIGYWIISGLISCLYLMLEKGELQIKDFLSGAIIILLGGIMIWPVVYEAHKEKVLAVAGFLYNIGEIKLWRSKSVITKEVLYGSVEHDEDDE